MSNANRALENFLTTGEAGLRLNPPVSGARIRQLLDQGVLPVAIKTARGQRLIAENDLLRLIAQRQAKRSATAVAVGTQDVED
jgi:hypothetical protein